MHTHRAPRALPWLMLSGTLALPACGSQDNDPDATGACGAGLFPGDLVISEIMADPPGADSGNEWFELYNAGTEELNLQGLLLVHSREDGTDAKLHRIARQWLLPSDDYGVAGARIDEEDLLAVTAYIDYGYEGELGDMRNSAGRLALACPTADGSTSELIDEAIYTDPTQGTSRSFTGERTPDAMGNDDLNLWCDATTALDEEVLATPGTINDICLGTGGPVSCIEDGEVRLARAPAPGDVVISEIMANPEASEEGDGEWFELYVGADIDLNGLELGKVVADGPEEAFASNDCEPVAAGTYLVFAASADPMANGGLPRVDALFDFSLRNSDGALFVGYAGEVLDELVYDRAPAGAALGLDPDFTTPEDNDDPRYLCDATLPYGAGDLGSPGDTNEQCPIPPPEGQCLDGDAFRDLVPPQPGDVVVTEIMPNPDAVGDTEGEWIELLVTAEVDLNGLQLGAESGEASTVLEPEACLRFSAGDYVVLAREAEAGINGELPQVNGLFDFSLRNSDALLWVGHRDVTLDEITWSSSPTGASLSLDPALADPAANDDEAAFCEAVDAYGAGDLGTPGGLNPSCGGVSTGTCLDGDRERDIVSPEPGDLVITELMPDPSAVSDANGEWFEVLVTADVDLNGLQLGRVPGDVDATVSPGGDCIAAALGDRVVFAKSDDMMVNGGLPPVAATFSFSLANAGGSLFVGVEDTVLDEVSYSGSTPGTAWTLDPAAETVDDNDDEANFCPATSPYGMGDLGTPGAEGPSCGGMVGAGMCLDGGVPRAVIPPAPGDLVINEWMPDPAVVSDNTGEWFEIYVGSDVDLNGLELSRQDGGGVFQIEATLTSADCLSISAGSYVLLARDPDAVDNGGLPAVDFTFGFNLNNSNNGLAVGYEGMHLDEVVYTSTSSGQATSLDPSAQTPAGNDIPGNLCPATTAYSVDNSGTPGAPNPSCP